MTTPNEVYENDSIYQALAGTVDPQSGITYPASSASPNSSPTVGVQRRRMYRRWNMILEAINAGRVVKEATALTVGIWGLNYDFKGTLTVYAGCTAQAVTDNATNYIYLDAANALIVNTTGFPVDADSFFPLATVVAAGGAIVSIADKRPLWRVVQAISAGAGITLTDGAISIAAGAILEAMLAEAVDAKLTDRAVVYGGDVVTMDDEVVTF